MNNYTLHLYNVSALSSTGDKALINLVDKHLDENRISSTFKNNIGIILDTSWNGVHSTLLYPQSNEKWNVAVVMEWEKVQFINNKIDSNGNYLMYNNNNHLHIYLY
ncbi:hypothetical protein RFI_31954 [Reticulomyxa filosa]|uniref:Uncharacterized protein n=1 Tax=Reticulomyxa filosa TaxID=46433 RepID=X6LU62_RETFI|nr:hypothetical protein RFI_31954 [Reticulomyxa filosa]|eukprot:ETO05443.1 hypothetical protein RFI_31954 [Reticulomyxa filosa]